MDKRIYATEQTLECRFMAIPGCSEPGPATAAVPPEPELKAWMLAFFCAASGSPLTADLHRSRLERGKVTLS